MNLKSQLRRTAVLTAGAVIGLSGAFALAGPASAHHSEVDGSYKCDYATGEWVVSWTTNAYSGVRNNPPTYEWTRVESTPATPKISNAKIAVTGEQLQDTVALTGEQRLSGTEKGASLTVEAKWSNGNKDKEPHTKTLTFEGKCEKTPPPSSPAPTPTASESTPPVIPALPGEPEPIFVEDCTTITIGLDNPADGTEITLKYKTSKGEQRTLVIKPGEKKSEKFSATQGFSVDVTFSATVQGEKYSETTTIKYDQPDDCDNGGTGGGLPVTGAAAGGIAGGAVVLLAVGAGLFVMARRRRVTFTA